MQEAFGESMQFSMQKVSNTKRKRTSALQTLRVVKDSRSVWSAKRLFRFSLKNDVNVYQYTKSDTLSEGNLNPVFIMSFTNECL